MDVETFKKTLEQFKDGHLNAIMIQPEIMRSMMDEYYGMSKWEWFVEGFRNISYIIGCYKDLQSNPEEYTFIRDDFWEALSWGWCCEYIFPYDDPYNPYISPERKLRLGRW